MGKSLVVWSADMECVGAKGGGSRFSSSPEGLMTVLGHADRAGRSGIIATA
jgi:hypothetical protein